MVDDSKIREDAFVDIIGRMKDVYLAKNRDYGNSFDDLLDELEAKGEKPEVVFYIRAKDKLNRIYSLAGKDPLVVSESKYDTVFDLANYSVMFLSWLMRREVR